MISMAEALKRVLHSLFVCVCSLFLGFDTVNCKLVIVCVCLSDLHM